MTTSDTSSAEVFRRNIEEFVGVVDRVVSGVLGAAPSGAASVTADASTAIIEFERFDVSIGGEPMLAIELSYGCRPDSSGDHIAVTKSKFSLWPINPRIGTPILRLDYFEAMHTKPRCHWNVHAERGDLLRPLIAAGSRSNDTAGLHLPVGGTRFRPCLEDFLEMLVRLGYDVTPPPNGHPPERGILFAGW